VSNSPENRWAEEFQRQQESRREPEMTNGEDRDVRVIRPERHREDFGSRPGHRLAEFASVSTLARAIMTPARA
jgi:hypothetical protein